MAGGCQVVITKPLIAYAATTIKWDYQGEENPTNWGRFSAVCATGKQQSPINIDLTDQGFAPEGSILALAALKDSLLRCHALKLLPSFDKQKLTNIFFDYQTSSMRILNNGRTVIVKGDRSSYIMLDNQRYKVKQFHYHSPSEHSLNEEFFPAELHLVHQQSDRYTVVAILLKEGQENLAYQPFIDRLPPQESPEIDLGITINLAELLPTNKTAYRYSGSLTTPPCTEGVNWLLMTNPVELSPAQITALKNVFNGNNRPIQMRNQNPLSFHNQ
jgi:carbonic anhydrase